MVYPYKYPFRVFDFRDPIGNFSIFSQKQGSFGKIKIKNYERETAYHNSNLSFSATQGHPKGCPFCVSEEIRTSNRVAAREGEFVHAAGGG
jgi:hypothetical protein